MAGAGGFQPWAARGQSPASPPDFPLVTVVCGAPGDEAHHARFEQRLGALRKVLTSRYGIPADGIRIYYGPESAGYAGPATRDRVKQACDKARAAIQGGRTVWFIVMGHANDAPGDVRFNLPGDDLPGKELTAWLKPDSSPAPAAAPAPAGAPGSAAAPGSVEASAPAVSPAAGTSVPSEGPAPGGTLNLILTTACGGRAVVHAAGPRRAVMAATDAVEGYDETVFPDALIQSLESPSTDADRDGRVSLTELFQAAKGRVDAVYRERGCIQTEHAVLDGDGDGRATRRPAEKDAAAASGPAHSLKIKPSGFSS